jgi:hypothetical protein
MQGWISLKQSLVAAAGIETDAVRILASLLLLMAFAFVTRRAFSNWLPWLGVLAAAFLNEVASLPGVTLRGADWTLPARDIVLTMVLPTMLLLLGRFAPTLLSAHHDRRIFIPAIWDKKAPVVETVFKKIDEPRPGRQGKAS